MSQINKYEITTLHGGNKQKHIVNALTAQDAIVQFKVKFDCDVYKIVNIEPYVQVWTSEDYMNYVNSQNKIRERIIEQQKSKPMPKKVFSFIDSFLK
jgi:hypothetical protein